MAFFKKHKNFSIFIICLIISFIFLLFASKSSPLYPINDWVDSNSFFTLGKGMINGKVIYRDLFEQKGPLLYLFHALAALISNTSFIGIYIIESISFSIFLYYSYKVLKLFFNNKYSLLTLPFEAFLTLYSYNFSHGDSAEEFCLPLLMISIYHLVNYIKNKKMDNKIVFINGIIAGTVLTIKYTMLGFWFAWMMMVFLSNLCSKQYKKAFLYCFIFLGGMVIPIIPWFIYFILNNGLKEFIYTYFIFNMTSYSKSISLIDRIQFIIDNFVINFKRNLIASLLTVFGLIYSVIDKKVSPFINKLIIIITYIFLFVGIYFGGVAYRYYYLITLPFMIFGFVFIGNYLKDIKIKFFKLLFIITIISLNIIIYKYGHNSYFMKIKKEDLVQYKFAEIIKKEKNPTLLNYGFLDGGFYLASNIIPNTKYFQLNNISYDDYPLILDSQNNYLNEKKVKFVITRKKGKKKRRFSNENYYLIATEKQIYQDNIYTYSLYGLK